MNRNLKQHFKFETALSQMKGYSSVCVDKSLGLKVESCSSYCSYKTSEDGTEVLEQTILADHIRTTYIRENNTMGGKKVGNDAFITN